MGLLDSLLGNAQQQQDYQEYAQRYQQGAPHEGYSDQEVVQRYQQVAPQLPPQDYQQAAEQAFSRMSPQDRMEFGQFVQQQMATQQPSMPGFGDGGNPRAYEDPRYLAEQTRQLHEQQPGMLTQMLGGGSGGGMLASPVAKAALAGIAAMAVSNAMGRGGMGGGNALGGLLGGARGGGNLL